MNDCAESPFVAPPDSGWLSLFSFTTAKHAPTLLGGIVVAIIASLPTPAFSILLGQIFNDFTLFGGRAITSHDLIHSTAKYCVRLATLGAISWICNGFYYTLFVIFGELQAANARTELFDGLLKRDQEWFETQQDGTRVYLSSLQGHIDDLQKATSQAFGLALQYMFRAIVSLILAFYTSWNLTLVTLAGMPVLSAIISFLSAKMNASFEVQKNELANASKIVDSATTSIDAVKSFNGQVVEHRNFVTSIDKAAVYYLRRARFTSLQIAFLRMMTFGMFIQGFWYGSSLATSGELSAGEVLRTFWACLAAAQSFEFIMPQLAVMKKGKIASIALRHALSDRADGKAPGLLDGATYPDVCEGDTEVKNLSFSYSSQPDRLSLNSTSFFFPAGETTFVIGKSGSGKSTLGQLLARFYMPTSGEILIDGHPIQTLSINWIRNNITLIEQRSVLFNESVFMNIAFGSRDHSRLRKPDIQECINLAKLESTIQAMPEGIETCVGHGGSFLSGGQRQRVAIARARLRDTPILIMDEPTSALDGTNRVEIMKAIREWRRGKTTIIITHDMSQIMDRDFAYILEHGSVVHAGYRHELEDNKLFFPLQSKKTTDNGDSNDEDESAISAMGHDPSASQSRDFYDPVRDAYMKEMMSTDTEHAGGLPSNRQSLFGSMLPRRAQRESIDSIAMEMIELNTIQANGAKAQLSRISRHVAFNNDALHRIDKTVADEHPEQAARLLPHERLPLRTILLTMIPNLTSGQRWLLALGSFSTLLHAMATPVFSFCLSQLLQTFYDSSTRASTWSLAVLGVSLADGVVSFAMHYLLDLCGQAWVDSIRKIGFVRILDQPRKWFDEEGNRPSQLTTCLNQNGEEMRNLVGRFGGYLLVAATVALTAIIWSMALCWKLTLVVLACGPVIYAITRGFERTTGLWERRSSGARTSASEVFIETFSEIRTVRNLTLEPFFHKKHLKAASLCTTIGIRKALYTGSLFGLVDSMIIFVSALIFYYGAVLVSSSEFSVEELMSVFSMLLFGIGYASTVLSWIPQIGTSQEMANQLLRLASLPNGSSHEHKGSLKVRQVAPVKITGLSFRYPSRSSALVLKDVSITIPRNSCTAIVGRSGSGKSTITSLLLNLYEIPRSAHGWPTIALAGVDIHQVHTPTLRSLISIVSQQPSIFPGTIQANITYGLEDASPLHQIYHVRAAAQAAGIDEFISSLAQGYLTVIGDGGVGLSGGQAQRLVIARALIRRPQILILDEATSSLDPTNAKIIRQTVQDLVAARLGLTVLIITHAREMMQIADKIVVLEHGRVVEDGPFNELARRNGGKLKALIEDPCEDKETDA
ncbi:ABC transporter ATP-binding protein [Aspergillus homomorphus CBS 101889]|uniref:ABC a-pheromone efflux pump AtrD n=1 Tax=Aspergillus homomorphus (strain CBS 101889) TaxID=1450537 RepID=A0A395I7U2_ASPHC|nr:ABC a-pheromone efflux pump AtrD [Aspergillus homomorphus CBS 101889]RAL16015.1 ABC a-pheromone efflux pump AtrD [Aspergillus homomorphus CBS 101889]